MRLESWNGHPIRFMDRDGEWWAVAKDLCKALDIKLTGHTFDSFPDDECGRYSIPVSSDKSKARKTQEVNVLNELGVYRLIFHSRLPEAEAFQDWVFDIIKKIREEVLGLKSYEVFRLMDNEHQKAAMCKLCESMRESVNVDYIKANTIADKAVSTMHGFPRLVKKAQMDEAMLRDREPILADTVDLMALNERFHLGLSVSEQVYRKYCTPVYGKTA
jgi:prophage antirepressor-like protein